MLADMDRGIGAVWSGVGGIDGAALVSVCATFSSDVSPDQWLLRDSPLVSITFRYNVAGSRQAPVLICPTIDR